MKMKIECTKQQYEVIRAIVNSLVGQLETRESYTKQSHKSHAKDVFYCQCPWKKVRLLQHMKRGMK